MPQPTWNCQSMLPLRDVIGNKIAVDLPREGEFASGGHPAVVLLAGYAAAARRSCWCGYRSP